MQNRKLPSYEKTDRGWGSGCSWHHSSIVKQRQASESSDHCLASQRTHLLTAQSIVPGRWVHSMMNSMSAKDSDGFKSGGTDRKVQAKTRVDFITIHPRLYSRTQLSPHLNTSNLSEEMTLNTPHWLSSRSDWGLEANASLTCQFHAAHIPMQWNSVHFQPTLGRNKYTNYYDAFLASCFLLEGFLNFIIANI